jgi:hypothetical protein
VSLSVLYYYPPSEPVTSFPILLRKIICAKRRLVFPASFSPRRKEAHEGAAYIRTKLFGIRGESFSLLISLFGCGVVALCFT